jgi:hypothetical protein
MDHPWLLGNIPLIVAKLNKPTTIDYWDIIPNDILHKIIKNALHVEFFQKYKNIHKRIDNIFSNCRVSGKMYDLHPIDIYMSIDSKFYPVSKEPSIEIMTQSYKHGFPFNNITVKKLNLALKINKIKGRSMLKKKIQKIQALLKI